MAILLGIDGTGPKTDEAYQKKFQNNFVNKIVRDSSINPENKKYLRGPTFIGSGLIHSIDTGFRFVIERYSITKEPILLTGFSRGAAGVIVIAEKLRKRQIPVTAMLLFDAIGRHLLVNAKTIPENVETVLHLRRDPTVGSREMFGNTGTKWNPPTIYEEEFFFCTHGGVGGRPWSVEFGLSDLPIKESFPDGLTKITFNEDTEGSKKVWQKAQTFIEKHGFFG